MGARYEKNDLTLDLAKNISRHHEDSQGITLNPCSLKCESKVKADLILVDKQSVIEYT
jgi:hypothetical protein